MPFRNVVQNQQRFFLASFEVIVSGLGCGRPAQRPEHTSGTGEVGQSGAGNPGLESGGEKPGIGAGR